MKDYYEVLGVSPQASAKDVKERFRFLSLAYHPDKFVTSSQREQAEELFKIKNEAYQVLSVNERRTLYDKKLKHGRRSSDVYNHQDGDRQGLASSIKELKSLKKMYLIGFCVLTIIMAGVIITLSSSGRSAKKGFVPVPMSTALAYAKNGFPGIQDVLSINRNDFDSEAKFRKRQQGAVITFNNAVRQHNPDYQAAIATLSLGDYDAASGKLPLSINWKFWTKQLDREGYIAIPGVKAEALLKEGNQKPIYVYLNIVEGELKISKILMIGLEEEMAVSFLPGGTVRYDPVSGMQFVWIPGGSFTMGSPTTDGDGHGSEKPAHEVFINGIWMGRYEVTQSQWEQIMGKNNSDSNNEQSTQGTSNYPVMTFNDEFLIRLNKSAMGDVYRLPSEAEWEYAARANSNGIYSFGDDTSKLKEYAWFNQNSGGAFHPVGELKPNKWGLYDMHGNVSELCEDAWHPNYDNAPIDGSVWKGGHKTFSLVRGGGIEDPPIFLRSASRSVSDRNNDSQFQPSGFRLVRSGGFLE
jgi:formylglycine-generating enzyme required for sulfatase activity